MRAKAAKALRRLDIRKKLTEKRYDKSSPWALCLGCWACFAPCAAPMTIVGSWFLNLISWTLRAFWQSLLTLWGIKFIPIILIALFAAAAPFHESQRVVIRILDIFWGCWDAMFNNWMRPWVQIIFDGLRPWLKVYNFIMQFIRASAKLVDNILRNYLVEGLQPGLCSLLGLLGGSQECDDAFDIVFDYMDITNPPDFPCPYPIDCVTPEDCLDEYLEYLKCAGESFLDNINIEQFEDFDIEDFLECRGYRTYKAFMVKRWGLPFKALVEIKREDQRLLDYENDPRYLPKSVREIAQKHMGPDSAKLDAAVASFNHRAFRDTNLFPNAEEYTEVVLELIIVNFNQIFLDFLDIAVWAVGHMVNFGGWMFANVLAFLNDGALDLVNDAASILISAYTYIVEEVLQLNCISDNFDYENLADDEDDLDGFVVDITQATVMGIINCPCQLVEDALFGENGFILNFPGGGGPTTYNPAWFRKPQHIPCALLTCIGMGCICTGFNSAAGPKMVPERLVTKCLKETLKTEICKIPGIPCAKKRSMGPTNATVPLEWASNASDLIHTPAPGPVSLRPQLEQLYASNTEVGAQLRSLDPVTLAMLNSAKDKLGPIELEAVYQHERTQRFFKVLWGDDKGPPKGYTTDNVLARFQREFIMNPLYGNIRLTKFRLFAELVQRKGFRHLDFIARSLGTRHFTNESKAWFDEKIPDHSGLGPRGRERIARKRGIPLDDVGKKPFEESGLTNAQMALRGFNRLITATTPLFDAFYWDPEIFNFAAPSWNDINAVLEAPPVREAARTAIGKTHAAMRENNEAEGGQAAWPEMVVRLHTSVTLMAYRFFTPHLLEGKVRELRGVSDAYARAVKAALPTLTEGKPLDTLMDDIVAGKTTIWDMHRYRHILRRRWVAHNITSKELATGRPDPSQLWTGFSIVPSMFADDEYVSVDYDPQLNPLLQQFGMGWEPVGAIEHPYDPVETEDRQFVPRGFEAIRPTRATMERRLMYERKMAIVQRVALMEHMGKPMPNSMSWLFEPMGGTRTIISEFETKMGSDNTKLPAAGAAAIVLPFLKNPKVLGSILGFVLATKPARTIAIQFFNRVLLPTFKNIYTEGLVEQLTLSEILDITLRFTDTTIDSAFYLINEGLRASILCNWWGIIGLILGRLVGPILTLIPYVGTVLAAVLAAASKVASYFVAFLSVAFAYCPPPVKFGVFTWNYISDLVNCGPNACETSGDCFSDAPCRCGSSAQYQSLFWALDGDRDAEPCPGMSGTCLCWADLPCDFTVPRSNINAPFENDCQQEFGWKTQEFGWYNYESVQQFITDGIWQLTAATWTNFIIGLKYITRTIVRGWEPWISENLLFGIFAVIATYLIILGRPTLIIVFFMLGAFIWLVTPVCATVVGDVLAPALEDASAAIRANLPSWLHWLAWPIDQLLDFLTFPNATSSDPLGSPRNGEFTCFVANSLSWLFGLGVAMLTVIFLFHLLAVGGLMGSFRCVSGLCLALPRCCWGGFLCCIGIINQSEEEEAGAQQNWNVADAIEEAVDDRDELQTAEGVYDAESGRKKSSRHRHNKRRAAQVQDSDKSKYT